MHAFGFDRIARGLASGVLVVGLSLLLACGGPPEETTEQPETEGTVELEQQTGVPDPSEQEAMRVERRAQFQERKAALLEQYDTNKNGVLDADERKAMGEERRAQFQERKAALLEQYDTNKNGVFDADERKAMRAERRASPQGE